MRGNRFLDKMDLVDPAFVEEADTLPVKKSYGWIKWGAVAACLGLIAASAFTAARLIGNIPTVQIEMAAPAEDAPAGMRKVMNYNGYRYAFMENGAVYRLSSEQLGDALGTLRYDIQANPQENAAKEFSATFALDGTVYEMTNYNPDFRVAVEWNGNYYICQRTGMTDNTPLDAAKYFEDARFSDTIKEISIYDHAGAEMLAECPAQENASLIAALSQAEPAQLSGEEYQQISKAQKEGKSYQLFFSLSDGTLYRMYVIPSLNIAMIGDGRYTLPENFINDFGQLFDGLKQPPLPER